MLEPLTELALAGDREEGDQQTALEEMRRRDGRPANLGVHPSEGG